MLAELEVRLTKLRLALMEIDKIATSHKKGGIGLAQQVARQALNEDDEMKSEERRKHEEIARITRVTRYRTPGEPGA